MYSKNRDTHVHILTHGAYSLFEPLGVMRALFHRWVRGEKKEEEEEEAI